MNKELYVVGIGPGAYDEMTLRACNALKNSELIVGYSAYIDLIRAYFPEKEFYATPMRGEAARCRYALEMAAAGRRTAVVCSGDAGVYGMAGLVYELRGESETPEIVVVGGLTAACTGAALLGAPLTHDFAVVSLSDRLTPWETIEKRLLCAAEADLTIVLYNPASHGRPEHLHRACGILLRVLPEDRLCGIVRCIGREGESRRVLTLGELKTAQVDMFCTVFIGNAAAQAVGGNFITPRGYRDV